MSQICCLKPLYKRRICGDVSTKNCISGQFDDMTILNAKIKFEYLIHPGQTAECAYKLDKLMFQAYHGSLIYKYLLCITLYTHLSDFIILYFAIV